MDRTTALKKIPTSLHAVADAYAASGLSWAAIIALLLKILPDILALFQQPTQLVVATDDHCSPELQAKATVAREAAGKAFCAAICVEHCCGCHEHE